MVTDVDDPIVDDDALDLETPSPEPVVPDKAQEPDTPEDSGSEMLDAVIADNPELKGEGDDDVMDITKPVVSEDADPEKEVEAGAKNPDDPDADVPEVKDDDAAEADDDSSSSEELGEVTPKELSRMKASVRRKVRALQEKANQVAELEPHAEAAKGLNNYLRENNIGNEDFQVLLGVGASLQKGDFKGFLEGIAPYVQLAQEAVGHRVPRDLQERVFNGELTEDMAKHLGQERIQQQMRQDALQKQVSRQEIEASQRAENDRVQTATRMQQAVTDWEAQIQTTDPDYAQKQAHVIRFTRAIFAERGLPTTEADAVAVAKEAYKQVNDLYRDVQPQKRATSPVPSATQGTTRVAPEPTSMAEAAMAGLRNAQEG